MSNMQEQPHISLLLWAFLLFLAGIDGFLLLEPLRELGARPFFLLYVIVVLVLLIQRRLLIDIKGLRYLVFVWMAAFLGFAAFGTRLEPFGDKTPFTQFAAHSLLFFIGFSPIALNLRLPLKQDVLIRAACLAMTAHGVFISLDGLAILAGGGRPFEGSFLGSVDRGFPTGLFSEPSYVAAYYGVLLPVCLHKAKPLTIVMASAIVGMLFFLGDVRSFFVVYGAGMAALVLLRWGISWKTMVLLTVSFLFLAEIAIALSLLSVESSLSSAYRFGNTLSFFNHAVEHDWLIGDGFGAAHFLYPRLDFPDFLYLSQEFEEMIRGGTNRAPVFNLWVRFFVEIGVVPSLILLAHMSVAFFTRGLSDPAKIFVAGSFMFTLSIDSYIYGMFSFALLLLFSSHRRAQYLRTVNGQTSIVNVLVREVH